MRSLVFCEHKNEINQKLSLLVQKLVDENKSEKFFVGLSGGSMIDTLVEVLPTIKTDWNRWLFFFCDERIVNFDDKESTFGLYKKRLAPKLPISLNQFITINPKLKAYDCCQDYITKMKAQFNRDCDKDWPMFDLLFLGIGPDGHTCSLFPEHPILREAFHWVASIEDSPKPPAERVTLTFPVLNNAKDAVFVVTGNGKAHVLKEILVEHKKLPAGLVHPTNGKVHWFITDDAAQLIPDEFRDKSV